MILSLVKILSFWRKTIPWEVFDGMIPDEWDDMMITACPVDRMIIIEIIV